MVKLIDLNCLLDQYQKDQQQKQAEYEYIKTKADKKTIASERQLLKNLAKKDDIDTDTSELSRYIPQLKIARTKLDYAKKSLAEAERFFKLTIVKSPISGFLTSTSIDLGQIIKAHEKTATIIANSPLLVDTKLSLKDSSWVIENQNNVTLIKKIIQL